MGKGALRMPAPRERSRSSKSACRNDPAGLSLQEVTEQGEGWHRDLGFQRTLPESLVSQTRPQPFGRTAGQPPPQLLLLLKSFQADIHQACLHPDPPGPLPLPWHDPEKGWCFFASRRELMSGWVLSPGTYQVGTFPAFL